MRLLPRPWRRSPWLSRGLYDEFPVEGTTQRLWVAVDSAGNEIAVAEPPYGRRLSERRRRQLREAASRVLGEVLFDLDPLPSDGRDPVPNHHGRYLEVAARLRDIQDSLLSPGLHMAPFRSRTGRPVLILISPTWVPLAIVEVDVTGRPFMVEDSYLKATDCSDVDWFTGYWEEPAFQGLDPRCPAQPPMLPPGIHVAPWLPKPGADYLMLGLDQYSRVVGARAVSLGERPEFEHVSAIEDLQGRLAFASPVMLPVKEG